MYTAQLRQITIDEWMFELFRLDRPSIFLVKKRGKTGEKFVGPLTTENTL